MHATLSCSLSARPTATVFTRRSRCIPTQLRSRAPCAGLHRRHYHNALIFGDLSNDATWAEVLLEMFGARVIGLQISRNGDGLMQERRPVGAGSMPIYTIGRSHLLELFHSELKLPRFRGHPTVWVFGVHNGKEAPTLRAGIPPADD